jgi:hypothetical protein
MATVARLGGIIFLIAATLVEPSKFSVLVRSDIQVIIAALVVFVLLFVDHILGFLIGLSVLILYSRVFMAKYGIKGFDLMNRSNMMAPYVTPKNLQDAQSNVVENEDEVYVGISGVYGEDVYSAQGLDKALPGYIPALGQDLQNTYA